VISYLKRKYAPKSKREREREREKRNNKEIIGMILFKILRYCMCLPCKKEANFQYKINYTSIQEGYQKIIIIIIIVK